MRSRPPSAPTRVARPDAAAPEGGVPALHLPGWQLYSPNVQPLRFWNRSFGSTPRLQPYSQAPVVEGAYVQAAGGASTSRPTSVAAGVVQSRYPVRSEPAMFEGHDSRQWLWWSRIALKLVPVGPFTYGAWLGGEQRYAVVR